MQQRQLRLGDILDDYCPRERRVTNHAVVAMLGSDVKQTRCTTCDAEHEYQTRESPAAAAQVGNSGGAVFAGARQCSQACRARRAPRRRERVERQPSSGGRRRRRHDRGRDRRTVRRRGRRARRAAAAGDAVRRAPGQSRRRGHGDRGQSRQRGRRARASAFDPRVAAAARRSAPADAADSRIHHPAARRPTESFPAATSARTGRRRRPAVRRQPRERQLCGPAARACVPVAAAGHRRG